MKLSLVIPAYNEAEGVHHTADRLSSVLSTLETNYRVEVIFVDDGSKDATLKLLRETFAGDPRFQIVAHEENKGPGAAIRTGFAHAAGDVIVTTDFDGTYSFDTIPQLVQQLIDQQADVVTASPYHPKGGVEGIPRLRLLFSYGASMIYRVLVSWRIHTWTAFYRAYRRPVIQSVSFEHNGFLGNTELLIHALRAGFKVTEFPTVLRRRQFGQSSLKVARVTLTHLKFIAGLLRNRVRGIKSPSIVTSPE